MKATIPEAHPARMVSARAGLPAISANIVLPEDTSSYNVFVKDDPMKISKGKAMISPSDHFPNFVFGISPPRG